MLTRLTRDFPDTLSVAYAVAKNEEAIGHYIVADNSVRIEKPHHRLTSAMAANAVEAKVVFNSHPQAERYAEPFKLLWGQLRPAALPR